MGNAPTDNSTIRKRGRPKNSDTQKEQVASRIVKTARLKKSVVDRGVKYVNQNVDELKEGPRTFSMLVEVALEFYLDEIDGRENLANSGYDSFDSFSSPSGYKLPGA